MGERLIDAPERIWAFEDEPGGIPKSGIWIDEQSECPEGSLEYVRADLLAESWMQSLADAGQAADAFDRAVKAEADLSAMTAERDALRAALKSIERKSGPGWGVHMQCIDIARKALGAS